MTDKIILANIASFQNDSTAVAQYNSNNTLTTSAFDNTLSRDGTSPNQMGSPLDMNSFQIINLPQPLSGNSPARLQDLSTVSGGGTISSIPAGGTVGQVLTKNSSAAYDASWGAPAGISGGLNVTATGTNPVTVATISNPVFSTSVTTPILVNTGTLTLPNTTDTLVGRTTVDTLSNKTLTAPIISTIANTGVLTLPTSTDTLVGRATTDTFSNKTFSNAVAINNGPTVTTPISGTLLQIVGNTSAQPIIETEAYGPSAGTIWGRLARGTAASPTATQNNDTIYQWVAQGYDGNPNWGGGISAVSLNAAETFSAGHNGQNIKFFTVPVGTTSNVLAATVQASGGLSVGTLTDPGIGTVISNCVATAAPITLTGTSGTITNLQSSVIFNASGAFTVTLPSAASFTGRWLYLKNIAAQTITSASSNVVPITSATAGTAILAATAGKYAVLQSDGTNWITMVAN
jgi:hypothetical protein